MDIIELVRKSDDDNVAFNTVYTYILKSPKIRNQIFDFIRENDKYNKVYLLYLYFEKRYDEILENCRNETFKYYIMGREYIADKDYTKANEYFAMAIEAKCGWGYYGLGINYADGNGMPQDYVDANKYFKIAGELGCGMGYYNLGHNYDNSYGVSQDYTEANKYFKMAGELGYGPGYTNLGYSYQEGLGVVKDYNEAYKYYKMAGELGCSVGFYNLAFVYQYGKHTVQDYTEANKYYMMAGELGNGNGYYELAQNYEKGNGIAASLDEALPYYSKALALGCDKHRFLPYLLKLVEYYDKLQAANESIQYKDKFAGRLIADGKITVVDGIVSQYL